MTRKKRDKQSVELAQSIIDTYQLENVQDMQNSLLKLLYLRVSELERKWTTGHIRDWPLVLNQLMMNETFTKRIEKYSVYL